MFLSKFIVLTKFIVLKGFFFSIRPMAKELVAIRSLGLVLGYF